MLPSFLLPSLLFPLRALARPAPFLHEVITPHPRDMSAAGAITQFRYSGSGCTQDSNSVSYSPAAGWTTQVYTFRQFAAGGTDDASENCELHFQGSGLGQGWQVSLSELDATGKFAGTGETSVNWFWQIYWSNDASNTVSVSSHKRERGRGGGR